jgi:hypothetical protein
MNLGSSVSEVSDIGDAGGVIYDHNRFIIQATDLASLKLINLIQVTEP